MSDMSPTRTETVMISPVPKDAPRCSLFDHKSFAAAHCYYDENGELLFHVFRLEAPDPDDATQIKKSFLPATFVVHPDGSHAWQYKAPPVPRSIYGRYSAASMPNAPVLIVEGEKCADAAQEALPDVAVMTWSGGSNAVDKTDFSPLKGRDVTIMPDHDAPGAKAAATLVETLRKIGASSVRVINIQALLVDKIGHAPNGGDIVDLIEAGVTFDDIHAFPIIQDHGAADVPPAVNVAPVVSVQTHLLDTYGHVVNLPREFALEDGGVKKMMINGQGDIETIFIASPLAVIGRTRTAADGAGWGLLVAYQTHLKAWETVVIPATMLAGDGREMRELLARRGVTCGQGRNERQGLMEYIGYAQTNNIIEVATRSGWNGESFVLPGQVISPEGAPRILPPEDNGAQNFFQKSGSFEGWQALSKTIAGSSRVVFGICVALAGPLARDVGETGGGFHFYDQSSRGKTSLLITCASVWGGGGRDGAVRSWTMTANGGETVAAQHSDTLLALDEIGTASDDELGEMIYRIVNGQGKARANTSGGATSSAQWSTMLLSAGEEPIATRLEGSGRGRRKSSLTGGLAVRMPDIPHSASEDRAFESIGNYANEAAFAEAMTAQAKTHYGHAGPAFVQRLVCDPDGTKRDVKGIIKAFVQDVLDPGADPQVQRVARRFGLAAAAGTLATRWEIVDWHPETAIRAAKTCFKAWLEARGAGGSTEELIALRQVAKFFETHGASRFEMIKRAEASDTDGETMAPRTDTTVIIRDRCGYRESLDEMVYYVTPQAWRSEVCAGISHVYVGKLLRDMGALVPDKDGRLQKNVRLPEASRPTRVYMIRPDQMEDME